MKRYTKRYTIDEFVAECIELMKNQYTYDYSRMPEGVCNGHQVEANRDFWHSINIDGIWDSLSFIDEEHPRGCCTYLEDGKELDVIDHLYYVLGK